MKSILLLLLLLVSTSALAKSPVSKTEAFFRVTFESQQPDVILLTQTSIDGMQGYFLSYTLNGKLLKKSALDKTLYGKLIANFGRALSDPRQKALITYTTTCGQVLNVKTKSVDRTICLDSASPQEKEAIAKWWQEIRALLRI